MNMKYSGIKWLSAILLLALCCADVASAATPATSTVELMGGKFSVYKAPKKESLYAISRRLGVGYDLLAQWNQGIQGAESQKQVWRI